MGNYSYRIDKERGVIVVKADGCIDFSQTIKIMDQIPFDPDFQKDYKVIVDLSEMEFHPSFNEFTDIKDNLVRLKEIYQNKIALVVVGLIKTLGDLIAELVNREGMKIKSFYTREKAEEWLFE